MTAYPDLLCGSTPHNRWKYRGESAMLCFAVMIEGLPLGCDPGLPLLAQSRTH
jgi:hypothetical protein